jgi:hypothetical protein
LKRKCQPENARQTQFSLYKNNFRARTLITKDFRLTLYEGADWGELYDLANDPMN